jgi:diadenosine tetraphosphate (Ap4A) HIT family hydrolase
MPADRIIETAEHAFVVLDAHPVSPGHTLVIARRHVDDVFDLRADEFTEVIRLIRSARIRLASTLNPTGFNIGVNVGKDAGQTIPHVHVHIIPRYAGDSTDPTGGIRRVIPGKARYP